MTDETTFTIDVPKYDVDDEGEFDLLNETDEYDQMPEKVKAPDFLDPIELWKRDYPDRAGFTKVTLYVDPLGSRYESRLVLQRGAWKKVIYGNAEQSYRFAIEDGRTLYALYIGKVARASTFERFLFQCQFLWFWIKKIIVLYILTPITVGLFASLGWMIAGNSWGWISSDNWREGTFVVVVFVVLFFVVVAAFGVSQ